MYYTYSVILNIRHQEQYGGQMQMEQIGEFVLAQEQHGSLMQVNFVLLHALKLLLLYIFYYQGSKNQNLSGGLLSLFTK